MTVMKLPRTRDDPENRPFDRGNFAVADLLPLKNVTRIPHPPLNFPTRETQNGTAIYACSLLRGSMIMRASSSTRYT